MDVRVGKTKASVLPIPCSEFLGVLMWLVCNTEQGGLSALERSQDWGLEGRRDLGSENEKQLK